MIILRSLVNTRALGGPILGIETSKITFSKFSGKAELRQAPPEDSIRSPELLCSLASFYSGNKCPFKLWSEPTKARAVCLTTLAMRKQCSAFLSAEHRAQRRAPSDRSSLVRHGPLPELTKVSNITFGGYQHCLDLQCTSSFPIELKPMEFWNQTNKRFQT